MPTLFSAVVCCECGLEMPPDPFATRCPACKSQWLEARYDCQALAARWGWRPGQRATPPGLAARPTSLWRYTELLPTSGDTAPVSLGEGWTPITRAEALELETGHDGLWIKDERQQPTGSFKDRQASVAISALMAQGINEIALASTGNAAAAYAAYCARAGIKLWVFLTSSVPNEKMRELALYGAEVVKIAGTYDQAKEIAADFASRRGIYLDGGAKAIPCKESMKTIAFEIVEQMGWTAPDWYIQAVSGGIGPLGVLKGFIELYEAGITNRVPHLGIVQTQGCAPMVQAWNRKLAHAEAVQPDSLITVLSTGNPGYSYVLLKRLMDTYGGAMTAVSDGDAFRAMRRVARQEGISMEPAASVAFAGLDRFLAQGDIKPGEQVVVNCSGHTFSAEKHALEDRYTLSLNTTAGHRPIEGLAAALEELDEQVTTLVVIDDNPHDNRLIRRLLQSYKHYRVFEAYTGRDGIDLVRQRRPDLVILDLTLPDMDGCTILSTLHADSQVSQIPVIVISARSLTAAEQEYLHRYTDSIWQKGNFSARELVSHVVEVLGDDVSELEPLLPPKAEIHPVSSFGQGQRTRILVAEDNVWEARLMRRLFESRQRFEVVETYTAAEALAAIAQKMPDLVLLDLLLPDMAGEKLLEQLRTSEATRQLPVVVITAKDLEPQELASLSRQASSVWSKGNLDRSSLLAHVEALLPG